MKKARLAYKEEKIIIEIPEPIFHIHELTERIAGLSSYTDEESNDNYYLTSPEGKAYDFLADWFDEKGKLEFGDNVCIDGFLNEKFTTDDIPIYCRFMTLKK